MSDDLLGKYIKASDKPEPHEPSIIRSEEHLPRLEIRESNGNSRSIPYSSLRYIRFNPSEGIKLVFDDCMLELSGVNLTRLYEALNVHRVKTILVRSDTFELKSPSATLVDSCVITIGDEKESLV